MDDRPIPLLQLPLFDYGESVTNIVELFPTVWKATESLTSPDPAIRLHGIDDLTELGAQLVSPLVAYMVSTCIDDPDIRIRRRVVSIVSELISPQPDQKQIPDDVRSTVMNYLHNMRQATVYALLEVSVSENHPGNALFHLFNACPYAGRHLSEILLDWKNPVEIRQKAVYYIGSVGYLEALPTLERLLNRLEARQVGQYSMAFAPPSMKSDDDLLPYLRIAISQLNAR